MSRSPPVKPAKFRTSWRTAGRSAGTYTVKVGVFRSGWTSLIHWNDQAGAVTLAKVAPTTTSPTTTSPTTTARADDDHGAGNHDHGSGADHHIDQPQYDDPAGVVGSVRDVGGGCGVAVRCAVCDTGA